MATAKNRPNRAASGTGVPSFFSGFGLDAIHALLPSFIMLAAILIIYGIYIGFGGIFAFCAFVVACALLIVFYGSCETCGLGKLKGNSHAPV